MFIFIPPPIKIYFTISYTQLTNATHNMTL